MVETETRLRHVYEAVGAPWLCYLVSLGIPIFFRQTEIDDVHLIRLLAKTHEELHREHK
jgi:hypothetical protein